MREKLPRDFYVIYFSKMFMGTGISLFFMFILLSIWYAYNSALVAAVPFILMAAIPSFFSPLIGTYVDRYSKRKIGGVSLLLSLLALIPLIYAHNIIAITVVFALLLFFESFFNTNYTVSVRNIVGDEKLMLANNLWVASVGINYVVAYILGAYIYSYLSFFVALALSTALYFIALLLWLFAHVPESPKKESRKAKYAEIFKILKNKKVLVQLIIIYDVLFLFVVLAKTPVYLAYMFKVIKMSSITYGIFNGISAFLLVIMALTLHRFIKTESIKKYALFSILSEALITLFIAFIPFIFASYIYRIAAFFGAVVLASFSSTLEMDSFLTIFQKAVPTSILGRFYSVRSLFRGIIYIAAYLTGGYIADTVGPVPMLIFTALFVLALILPLRRILNELPS
ncbi:MAG: MFS transporter [Euryarchaeota archaeon]|nr:MFS transporter [Euryarchaeota archaeon]